MIYLMYFLHHNVKKRQKMRRQTMPNIIISTETITRKNVVGNKKEAEEERWTINFRLSFSWKEAYIWTYLGLCACINASIFFSKKLSYRNLLRMFIWKNTHTLCNRKNHQNIAKSYKIMKQFGFFFLMRL